MNWFQIKLILHASGYTRGKIHNIYFQVLILVIRGASNSLIYLVFHTIEDLHNCVFLSQLMLLLSSQS